MAVRWTLSAIHWIRSTAVVLRVAWKSMEVLCSVVECVSAAEREVQVAVVCVQLQMYGWLVEAVANTISPPVTFLQCVVAI